jgi:hypothetical protein
MAVMAGHSDTSFDFKKQCKRVGAMCVALELIGTSCIDISEFWDEEQIAEESRILLLHLWCLQNRQKVWWHMLGTGIWELQWCRDAASWQLMVAQTCDHSAGQGGSECHPTMTVDTTPLF